MVTRTALALGSPKPAFAEEECIDEVIDKSTDFRWWQIPLQKSFFVTEHKS
jgi:hypothetical protein